MENGLMLFDLSFVETNAIRYNPALDLLSSTINAERWLSGRKRHPGKVV
jgi:hypothetical protein